MSVSRDDLQKGLDQTRAYWEARAKAPGNDLDKQEWSHKRTQRMRFEAFLLQHDLNGKSVLDVGCGLGDFYAHLQQRRIDARYVGYDLAEGMIEHCRERYPDQHFESGDFFETLSGRFDYTVAFGIHNVRVDSGRQILEMVTRRQYQLARIAAYVSLLTDRYIHFAPHLQAWHPEELLSLALQITPYVSLQHNYLHNDFSITLYHEPISKAGPDMLLKYEGE
jgi:SAM-dependent methyltransferase